MCFNGAIPVKGWKCDSREAAEKFAASFNGAIPVKGWKLDYAANADFDKYASMGPSL